jgi:uncharacterized Zn-binding protein involved in type VI secretion
VGVPAAVQGSQVVSTDIHIVMVPTPGGPVPTPLPHPFTGQINADTISTVKIGGQPAAVVGSRAADQPSHLPTPPGTSFQKPPSNEGSVFMGSATVKIAGRAAARTGDPVTTCNDPADLPSGSLIAAGTVSIG